MSLRVKLASIVALVAAGLGIWLFPTAANWLAVTFDSRDLTVASSISTAEVGFDQPYLDAQRYNQRLSLGQEGLLDQRSDSAYRTALTTPNTPEISRVVIPKINVSLRVYPGTDDDSLEKGAGHLYGTSLPVGGAGTHSAITAHSGLSLAKRFTDLAKLEMGDTFTLLTRGHQLHYRVDQMIVVPAGEETALFATEPGEDYVTLITCTPIGINTHRLLVRGVAYTPDPALSETRLLHVTAGFPWWAVIWLAGVGAALYGTRHLRLRFGPRGPQHLVHPQKDVRPAVVIGDLFDGWQHTHPYHRELSATH
ncbi:MAG: class C sortase [Promicromonosporaceae bacterium]|nr:class C sortase [Promicromonosporaceae bacterium]